MELINEVSKNNKKLIHEIYMFKILLLITSDKQLKQECSDKLNYIEKLSETITKNIDMYKETNNHVIYNLIDNDYYTIKKLLGELKEDLYKQFRLAVLVIIDNMKNDDIIVFYNQLSNKLIGFKDIDEACTYIYYHSGEALSSFIRELVLYLKKNSNEKTQKMVGLDYYLSKENIITIYYKEWIEIFEHLRFTMKYLSCNNQDYLKLYHMYQTLLVDSFIVISGGKVSEA